MLPNKALRVINEKIFNAPVPLVPPPDEIARMSLALDGKLRPTTEGGAIRSTGGSLFLPPSGATEGADRVVRDARPQDMGVCILPSSPYKAGKGIAGS